MTTSPRLRPGRCLPLVRSGFAVFGSLLLVGCFSASDLKPSGSNGRSPHINDTTKFSSRAYGVAASKRVTRARKVRKGGGRRLVGKPYKIRGKWYYPGPAKGYDKTGQASWYGPNFHGRLTANGEIYDQYALSAAHPTFPLPSYARVTNTKNGKSVVVRVNDRGPFHSGRIIDLSARASELLDYQNAGVARVRVQYIGDAPLHGKDDAYLATTFRSGGSRMASSVTPAARAIGQATVSRALPPVTRGGPRPTGMVLNEMLDAMKTGSVSKTKGSPSSERKFDARQESQMLLGKEANTSKSTGSHPFH